jgi:TolB-like protein
MLARYFSESGKNDPVVFSIALGSYRVSFLKSGPLRPALLPVLGVVEFAGINLSPNWRSFPALLAEEFLFALGGTRELRLLGPFSRARLEAEGIESVSLGRRHKVDFILDGSICEFKERQTLRVRLLEGGTGLLVWSAKYEWGSGEPWNLATLETDLMRRISAEIGIDFGPLNAHLSTLARIKPSHAVALHEAASLAKSFFQTLAIEDEEPAEQALRSLVRTHPGEALPYSLLTLLLSTIAFEPRSPRALPVAEISSLARKASCRDSASLWTLNAEAVSAVFEARDADLAAIARRAIADPIAPKILLGSMGLWMSYRKVDRDEGLRLIDEACRENPHHPSVLRLGPCLAYLDAADWNGALREIDAYGISRGWCDPLVRATAHAALGDKDRAHTEWQRVLAYDPLFDKTGLARCETVWHPDYTAVVAKKLRAAGIRIAHRSR